MDAFEKITISQLIWYFLPGLYVVLIILLPIVGVDPKFAKPFFASIGPVGIITLALVSGFLVDGLRLYRLRPKYSKIKKEFFKTLSKRVKKRDPYFVLDQTVIHARTNSSSEVRFNHSIWIMLGQMSFLTWVHTMAWIISPILQYYLFGVVKTFGSTFDIQKTLFCYGIITLISTAIAARLTYMSLEEQKKTNGIYIDYLKSNPDLFK